jgi:hypothetical protein
MSDQFALATEAASSIAVTGEIDVRTAPKFAAACAPRTPPNRVPQRAKQDAMEMDYRLRGHAASEALAVEALELGGRATAAAPLVNRVAHFGASTRLVTFGHYASSEGTGHERAPVPRLSWGV